MPRAGVVPESSFQAPGEPYAGHWRTPPAPWPEDVTAGPEGRRRLREGLDALPALWRAVVEARDVDHRPPVEVAERLGLTVAEEQQVLAHARAALRDELTRLVEGRPTR